MGHRNTERALTKSAQVISLAKTSQGLSEMPVVNMLEAKSNLSRLVEAVESGTESEIIIARNGKPAAKLVPLTPPPTGPRIGVAKGRFSVPDDIDADNEAIEKLFGGNAE